MDASAPITETFVPLDGAGLPLLDGRNKRSRISRAALLLACRTLMLSGHFRPSMTWICTNAGRAVRTGFDHFASIEELHLDTLRDPSVRTAIAVQLLGDEFVAVSEETRDRLVRAVVTSRGC